MSYLISNGQIVAKTSATMASGQSVAFSGTRVAEEINAGRQWNLVNAQRATIGNGKTWDAKWAKLEDGRMASEINPGEFFIA